jgi:hypothetical protein
MRVVVILASLVLVDSSASRAEDLACAAAGPQAPRDITNKAGTNAKTFPLAPPVMQMNLCNIHYHERAEHSGPGFNLKAPEGAGFLCNDTTALDAVAKKAVAKSDEACDKLEPGSTIEVHWVYTSCPVKIEKGKGLDACTTCASPTLRVEAQVFLIVNDPTAEDFTAFDFKSTAVLIFRPSRCQRVREHPSCSTAQLPAAVTTTLRSARQLRRLGACVPTAQGWTSYRCTRGVNQTCSANTRATMYVSHWRAGTRLAG